MMKTLTFVALGLALALPIAAESASDRVVSHQVVAEDPVPTHPEGARAIGRLRSPFCPGFMLENCTSGTAATLRDSLNTLAAEGWTAESLVDWMVGNHGEQYRAMPKIGRGGLLAWLGPPLFLLAGLSLVVVVLRRIRAHAPVPVPLSPLSPQEESRIEAALRELETEDD